MAFDRTQTGDDATLDTPAIRGPSSGCLFCSIASRAAPAEVIAERSDFIAILDIDPITPGHCLVVARRHIAELDELDPLEWTGLGSMIRRVRAMMQSALAPAGISLMQNGGAMADVPHFHVHVIPRHIDDGFGWQEGTAAGTASAPASLAAMGARLRGQS